MGGELLFTCKVNISSVASPGQYQLVISNVTFTYYTDTPTYGSGWTTGTNGTIIVQVPTATPTKTGTPAATPTPTPTPPGKPLGDSCSGASVCQSGFCVNGVCCSSTCPFDPMRCDIYGHKGTRSQPLPIGGNCEKNTDCEQGLVCNPDTKLCALPPPFRTPTPLPPSPTPTPRIHINIGSARGGPGNTVSITVSLAASGVSVAATANDIMFDSGALSLDPAQCQVNSTIGKSLTAGTVGSGWVRVFVQAKPSTSAIRDGPLYTCTVSIAGLALPDTYPLWNGNTAAFSPAGAQLSGVAGAEGFVIVSLVPQACIGDCNNNQQVTVADILTVVNIALGNALLSDCEAGDINGDGYITVDEILTAVNNALNGCL